MTQSQIVGTQQQEAPPLKAETPASETVADANIITKALEGGKKWGGKFDTPEEMEKAYNNTAKVYQENQELKKQLEDRAKAPDDYKVTDTVKMSEGELKGLKELAKKAGLTQDQFLRTAEEIQQITKSQLESFEVRKKSIGDDQMIKLQDYVKKVSPGNEALQASMLNTLINDENARTRAFEHRSKLLNTGAPGMSSGNTIDLSKKTDGKAELLKMRKEMAANPRDTDLQKKYIEKAREYAHDSGHAKDMERMSR